MGGLCVPAYPAGEHAMTHRAMGRRAGCDHTDGIGGFSSHARNWRCPQFTMGSEPKRHPQTHLDEAAHQIRWRRHETPVFDTPANVPHARIASTGRGPR